MITLSAEGDKLSALLVSRFKRVSESSHFTVNFELCYFVFFLLQTLWHKTLSLVTSHPISVSKTDVIGLQYGILRCFFFIVQS